MIRFYAGHECLWNKLHDEYSNLSKRHQLWTWIAKQFGPNVSGYEVECVMKNLRREALDEFRRIEACKKRGGLCGKPSFDLLDEFLFLLPQQVKVESTAPAKAPAYNMQPSRPVLQPDSGAFEDSESLQFSDEVSDSVDSANPDVDAITTFLSSGSGEDSDADLDEFCHELRQELDAGSSPRRLNAFNVTISRRAKFHTLLSQKDTVTKLINLYRQNECLWNPSCPDYKSAEYQEKVWKDIASAIDTNMPVVPVKRKVHVLRDQWEAAGRKELPMPKLFDYPDFGFLTHAVAETAASAVEQLTNIQVVELDRIDSGSEAMQADLTDFAESSNRNTSNTEQTVALLPSEYIISNKGQHIANLCEQSGKSLMYYVMRS
ncbi:GL25863 [Drosophila persimilis]|uniref:GL25863 n=1 Tax=Drosophila persimilis TaxID=7234 RepID=B4GJI8_DROPE|nr:GL25863 [Drosophila persimilis]